MASTNLSRGPEALTEKAQALVSAAEGADTEIVKGCAAYADSIAQFVRIADAPPGELDEVWANWTRGVSREPMEWREQQAAEALEGLRAHEEGVVSAVQAHAELLGYAIRDAALPVLSAPADEIRLVREELKMVLDAEADPVQLLTTCRRLVDRFGDQGIHAGVLVSSWTESYFAARGVPGFGDALKEEIAIRAPQHGGPAQAAAGRALAVWDSSGLGGLSGPMPRTVLNLRWSGWSAGRRVGSR